MEKMLILAIVMPFVIKTVIDTIFWVLEFLPWSTAPENTILIATIKRLLSLVLGLCAPFIFNVGVLRTAGVEVNWIIDNVITGLMLARGSNIINDFLDTIGKTKLLSIQK